LEHEGVVEQEGIELVEQEGVILEHEGVIEQEWVEVAHEWVKARDDRGLMADRGISD